MKCSICHKNIFYNLSFKDLFKFTFICDDCRKLITPKLTKIPINDGYFINYYYFLTDDNKEEISEYFFNRKIIDIVNKNRKTVVLLFDEETIPYLFYLNFHMDITLISIYYYDLSILEDL